MYFVGLIGSIASGKSTVISLLKSQAITSISADEVAHELTAAKQPALENIVAHFGEEILSPAGELDRAALRALILAKPLERQWLEKLLHPLIRQAIQEKAFKSTSPYTIIEIPLLKTLHDYPYLNRVLLIISPPEQQIKRLMQRDKISTDQAMAILNVQAPYLSRIKLANDIVLNNRNLADLEKKIKKLHQYYLQLASQAAS